MLKLQNAVCRSFACLSQLFCVFAEQKKSVPNHSGRKPVGLLPLFLQRGGSCILLAGCSYYRLKVAIPLHILLLYCRLGFLVAVSLLAGGGAETGLGAGLEGLAAGF